MNFNHLVTGQGVLITIFFTKAKKEEILNTKAHWIEEKKEALSKETAEYEYKKRRLIVHYCSKRASKDASDRQRLIDRLMKKIKKNYILFI